MSELRVAKRDARGRLDMTDQGLVAGRTVARTGGSL